MQRRLAGRRFFSKLLISATGLIAGLTLQPSHAAAQWVGVAGAWSAPGSTGVVDEQSAPLVTFDHATAAVRPTAPAGSVVVLRYPVFLSGTWTLWQPDPIDNTGHFLAGYYRHAKLSLSFQRNDDVGQIVAILRRVRLSDGETTVMAAVDGNASPPSPSVQTVTRPLECLESCIQQDLYAYWVEVALWKIRATSAPKVVGVGVHLTY
jgi:hypothetical protein